MATVLVVGNHPEVTRYVTERLNALGWTAISALGPGAGLRALSELQEVDAMVVGGGAVMAARRRLEARLHERHPYAQVIIPTSPDGVAADLERAFGGDAH